MSDESSCCFFSTSHCVSWEFPLCVSLCSGDVAWMGSQHLGFKRKQQPELLSVWKPRLRCSVSSAIVLVIVNLGHLPGGISHSSNKFHKTNHKVLHRRLPLIEFWAHKHISSVLQQGIDFLMTSYLKYGCHVCLFVRFPDRKPAHLEAWRFFFFFGQNEEGEEGRWRVKGG